MKQCGVFSLFLVVCFLWVIPAVHADVNLSAEIDLVVVQEKINSLGLEDHTYRNNERPVQWLKQHRETILAQLLEGLDAEQERIGLGCLKVLSGMAPHDLIRDKLVEIAENRNHIIHCQTMLALCAYAQDQKARPFFTRALPDTARFSDPKDRATIAEALGLKAKAVALLAPLLTQKLDDYDILRIMRRLEDIGDMSAVPALKKISHDVRWDLASKAYLILDQLDPAHHGLTEGQIQFLTEARRRFKETSSRLTTRWGKLAELPRQEIRSYVLQMLNSDQPQAALEILQVWRDVDALPQILSRAQRSSNWRRGESYAAYLLIDESDASIDDVCAMLARSGDQRALVGSVSRSPMSRERKYYLLNRCRTVLGAETVAKSLCMGNEDEVAMIQDLMRSETDVVALGRYARLACQDPQRRFGQEVSNALERTAVLRPVNLDVAMQSILNACAEYALPNSGLLTNQLLTEKVSVPIRLAAARVSAMFGGDRTLGLKLLHDAVNAVDVERCKASVHYLALVPCLNEQERGQRELLILSHLGKPKEGLVLRLLATCSGSKTTKRLSPLLDGQDVQRAVHAAWILAQHKTDQAIQDKAMRRLAIYALFRHMMYQTGSGIDFDVAPDLRFHQTISSQRFQSNRKMPRLTIPKHLLTPFTWDKSEQAFALRAYRYTRLSSWRHGPSPLPLMRAVPGHTPWDRSHESLFKSVAKEDPYVVPLPVRGIIVAHFPNRKMGAQTLANITGSKVSYCGLVGDAIDSEGFPEEPYPQQNQRVGAHILDLIQAVGVRRDPFDRRHERQLEVFRYVIIGWIGKVGRDSEFTQALISESHQRNLYDALVKLRFSIWSER